MMDKLKALELEELARQKEEQGGEKGEKRGSDNY